MRLVAKSHKFGSMTMKLKKVGLKNLKSSPTKPSKLDWMTPTTNMSAKAHELEGKHAV